MRSSFTLTLLLLITETVFAQSNVMNQGELVSQNVYHEIPFSNTRDEIVQAVKLRGKSFDFILDTGAPLSISKELQAENNYPILHKASLRDAGNNSDIVLIVMIDTIRFGDIVLKDIPALVLDFKYSPIGCHNINGLIGSNIARFFVVQFDLSNHKIIFSDNADKINIANKELSQPIFLDNQSDAFLEVKLTGSLVDTAHFDSGMGRFYVMKTNKTESFISMLDKKNNTILTGLGVSGQGILGKGKEEKIYKINTDIMLANNTIRGAEIGTTQTVSRLGRELLNFGTLTIDYINQQYYFEKYPNRFNKPKPDYGFEIIIEDGKVTASVVWEHTPAQKSGLYTGAEIVSINSKTFQKLTSCEIEKILTDEFSKNKIKIKYTKNGVLKNCLFKALN